MRWQLNTCKSKGRVRASLTKILSRIKIFGWRPSQPICVRRIPRHLERLDASRRISAHLSASQCISTHLSASQGISGHLMASRAPKGSSEIDCRRCLAHLCQSWAPARKTPRRHHRPNRRRAQVQLPVHMVGLQERMKGPRYNVFGPWPVCPPHIAAQYP